MIVKEVHCLVGSSGRRPLPLCRSLALSARVKLAPQQWSPVGKSWIKVINASEFTEGDRLLDEGRELRFKFVKLPVTQSD